jgi:hypothetical protein
MYVYMYVYVCVYVCVYVYVCLFTCIYAYIYVSVRELVSECVCVGEGGGERTHQMLGFFHAHVVLDRIIHRLLAQLRGLS